MIERRHFLQFAGSTIATLSLSHIIQQSNRYAQVLAQSTPRKLALLVGINKYPPNQRSFVDLNGCVTDVKLQEELLVYRFGFNRNDIVKLTTDSPPEYQPTRKNILKQFEEHLINQAKPGDVVVFHFSGHGSFLRDPNPIKNCTNAKFDELNSTLVVADEAQNNLAPDIMGRTLFLLRSALKTDNVTMVLDSCFSGGGTRGNLVIRSVPGDGLDPLPKEIAYQQRWMKHLGLTTEEELRKRRCAGVGNGVVIASAKKEEVAADRPFDGFSAGAFTYLLTQYLWQQKDTVGNTIAEIKNTIKPLSGQVPVVDGNESKSIYFISSQQTPPSDAVISKVEGEKITLWLGGVDYDSLTGFQRGATFAILDGRGKASGTLELISPRGGLVAEAKLVGRPTSISLKPGTLLQESSRVIPADLKLAIGLDPSVAEEASTAQAALSKINRIEAVPAQRGNPPYPGGIEYILSRMTKDYLRLQKQGDKLPAVGSIGLFTEGLELILQSFGQPGETITAAVSRLEAKIKSLLATLIIKKTLNSNSSELDVEVAMNLVESPNKILAKTATLRGRNNRESKQVYSNRLPLNKQFQFRVTNNTNDDLYVTILLVESSGELLVVFPYKKNITDNTLLLKPSETLVAGQPGQMELQAVEKGSAEALVIVSRSPLKKAVKALQSLAAEQNRSSGPIEISREPVELISDLLADLSRERGGGINLQYKEVKAAEIATLSMSFDVG